MLGKKKILKRLNSVQWFSDTLGSYFLIAPLLDLVSQTRNKHRFKLHN